MPASPFAWLERVERMPDVWGSASAQGSFSRLWRAFMSARIVIASVLLGLQALAYAMGGESQDWSLIVCLLYLGASIAVRFGSQPKPPGRSFDAQWLASIGVDVATFSVLNLLQSAGINYTPLMALPVLAAAVLGPLLLALGTAASVTLLLLADAWWQALPTLADLPARFLQSSLNGSGFFAIALLANQLAVRLAREEELAKANQSAAQMQAQVSELVVQTLTDGVLVIDRHGVVHAANPAARFMLQESQTNCAPPFALSSEVGWQQLAQFARASFVLGAPQEADVTLYDQNHRFSRLHLRTRLANAPDSASRSLCVMFLQDLRTAEARIRTEKMASMGRMSAAIAHEIRNPLAAISQANALLEEDLQLPAQRQLSTIVRQNTQRLARIVDEVLDISRVQPRDPAELGAHLKLNQTVARICADWADQADGAAPVQIDLAEPAASNHSVLFDADHLRRVLINLLDNAQRHAGQAKRLQGVVRVSSQWREPSLPVLTVWSDGPPIETSVERHLFEPFFSSQSRSSGLGLYICRELCERYGAQIGHRRERHGERDGNAFFVIFRSAPTDPESAQISFFDPL